VAEEFLFRHLLLYADTGSFEKLDHVSTHPRFSHYVRGITYSSILLPEDDWLGDRAFKFRGWRQKIGYGMNLDKYDYATLVHLPLAEHKRHYSAYAAHVQSQIALRKGHREIRWLKTMLGRLPKLERLGYAAQRSGGMGILDLDGTKGLTPLMRATLMDRRLHAD